MPKEKKRKRSHSRSKSRESRRRKTDEKLEKMEEQIANLTSLVTKLFQKDPEVLKSPIEESTESNNKKLTESTEPAEVLQPEDKLQKEVYLEILGEHPNARKQIPITINNELKIRWEKWMQEGYPEEDKKTILEIYPRKDDLYTEAPKVNLEISPVMTEIAIKRDEHFTETQNCIGSAISALGAAVSMVLEDPEDGVDQESLMKYLCDTGKLLTDVFHQHSLARRAYITPLMNKSIKPTVEATKADEWLYGKKFAELVKEAKDVEKACSNIKATFKTANQKSKDQGNSKYPPAKYKQVGSQNRKIIKFKPRPQKTNYNTPKPSIRSSNRYPPPKK